MLEQQNPYADIISLPHHKAADRPHMSLYDRAAQFSPFAALTGFEGVIAETGRMTDRKIELSESEKIMLDQKLTLIDDVIQDGHYPIITLVFFVPDARKEGGEYQDFIGQVRQMVESDRHAVPSHRRRGSPRVVVAQGAAGLLLQGTGTAAARQ